MRLLVAATLGLALASCQKERAKLAIDGISITVPADFVPMAPERVAALREAAMTADPDVDVSMVGRKPKGAALPWMYVQRSSMPPRLKARLTVAQVLESTVGEIKKAIGEGGLEVVESTSSVIGETHETCFVTRSKKAPAVLNHQCLRVWFSEGRVMTASVVCLSEAEGREECDRVLKSRELTPSNPTPLTTLVGS